MSRKTETLKAALKAMSEIAAQLRDAGLDEMAAEVRATMSKIRRELNHLDTVRNHPDLFG